MRDSTDPGVAGCRRSHRARLRQLQLLGRAEHVHGEAGRGVRHVIAEGAVVVRGRRLTTMDEEDIYDAVESVMPAFRKDFGAISERVLLLQPYLDQAHRRFVDTSMEFDRIYIPF